jgi:hypothetical protein
VTWGLDLLGPFRRAPGGYTHLLVTIDKFTKWIEAKPVARVRSEDIVEFFLDIIYRFGVPNSIITDNGTLFTVKKWPHWSARKIINRMFLSTVPSLASSACRSPCGPLHCIIRPYLV